MKEPVLVNLFPSPVAVYELGRPFTTEETNQIEGFCSEQENNFGNTNSKEKYCLDIDSMSNLRKFCSDAIDKYMIDIVSSDAGACTITQSWVNVSRKGQYHHRHSHANSYLSGVLYFETNEDDKISFYNPRVTQLLPKFKELTFFNSTNWFLWAVKATLVVFPSWLEHSVPQVEYDRRVSLSFNTFLQGEIGSGASMTKLVINSK